MLMFQFLLGLAANNDAAEGRIEAAITKWHSLIRMENHLRQQPQLFYHAIPSFYHDSISQSIVQFVVHAELAERYLHEIESLPLQTHDDWDALMDRITPVEELAEQKIKKQLSLLGRLKYEFQSGLFSNIKDRQYEHVCSIHNRMLASNRAVRILVSLRRYRNDNGTWPETLYEIRSQVPSEVLIDPLNKGSFVYKLTDDGFVLYSKGQNKIDEGGRNNDGADDWPIWPTINKIREQEKTDSE